MTEQHRWLCPHCRCPLRFRDFRPGEQIFPCPDCEQPIQIVTSGRQITAILAVPEITAPAAQISRTTFPLVSWSKTVLAGAVISPRGISAFVTLVLGVALVGVWIANRPLPVRTAVVDLPADVAVIENEFPAEKPLGNASAPIVAPAVREPEEEDTAEAPEDDVVIAGEPDDKPTPAIDSDAAVASLPYGSSFEPTISTTSISSASDPEIDDAVEAEVPTRDEAIAEPKVDIVKALAIRVARWEQAQAIPLIEILDQFEEMVGGEIVLDEFDSPEMQKRLAEPVSFSHRQKSFAEILTLLLDNAGLRYDVRENTIHIAPALP